MAKRGKQYVPWLAEGERGWVKPSGRAWKWDGVKMWGGIPAHNSWCGYPDMRPSDCDRYTEVFPRPAAKPPKQRRVRAWGHIDKNTGKLCGVSVTKQTAEIFQSMFEGVGSVIVPGTFTYTPKGKKR